MKHLSMATLVFVAGTVVSTAVGIISSVFLNDKATGLTAGLVSETLTTVLVLWVRISEVHESVSREISHVLELSTLYEKVAELEDPLFTEKYNQLRWHLRELSEGRYLMHNLNEVYEDDTRSIELMKKDEVLRSICPLARDTDPVDQQLSNKSYLASIDAHINAAKKGVRVFRIYALPDFELLENEKLRAHLSQLVDADVKVYYIIYGDPRFRQAETIDLDFLIFGDRKVSIGKIDPRSEVVSGAIVVTDKTTVAKYIRDYNTLLRIAEPYAKTQSVH